MQQRSAGRGRARARSPFILILRNWSQMLGSMSPGAANEIGQQLNNLCAGNLAAPDEKFNLHRGMVIMVDPTPDLPPSAGDIPVYTVGLASDEDIRAYIEERLVAEHEFCDPEIIERYVSEDQIDFGPKYDEFVTAAANQLRSLTWPAMEDTFSMAAVDNGSRFNMDMLTHMERGMIARINKIPGLRYVPLEQIEPDDMPGFQPLYDLADRLSHIPQEVIETHRLSPPRGPLLAGVPGTGKTQAILQFAKRMGRPAIFMNIGQLMNRFVGKTDENLRLALETARGKHAVLILDDMDKAGIGPNATNSDSGVTDRIVNTLLTELTSDSQLIIAMTCNDVSQVRSEMYRDGRTSAQFRVELPDKATRHQILKFLRQRHSFDDGFVFAGKNNKPMSEEATAEFFLDLAGERTDGWVGGELAVMFETALQQATVSGSKTDDGRYTVQTTWLREYIERKTPLSKQTAGKEQLDRMDQAASGFERLKDAMVLRANCAS